MQPKSNLSSVSRDPYSLTQQETPAAFPEHPEKLNLLQTRRRLPGQQSEAPEEGEPTSTQEEASSQLPQTPEAAEYSPPLRTLSSGHSVP